MEAQKIYKSHWFHKAQGFKLIYNSRDFLVSWIWITWGLTLWFEYYVVRKGKRLDLIKLFYFVQKTIRETYCFGFRFEDIDNSFSYSVGSKSNRVCKRSDLDWCLRDKGLHRSLSSDFDSGLYHREEQMCVFVNMF